MYQITSTDFLVRNLLMLAALGALIWLVAALLRYWHQRAYNLTRAEGARSDDIRPDFLRVDKDMREAAIRAGEGGATQPKSTSNAAELQRSMPQARNLDLVTRISRVVALLSAIASFIAAALGALGRVPDMSRTAAGYSSVESLMTNVRLYPIGFAIAAVIICTQFIHLVLKFSIFKRT